LGHAAARIGVAIAMAIRVEAGPRDMSGPEIARAALAWPFDRQLIASHGQGGLDRDDFSALGRKEQAIIAGAQGICPIPVLFDARHQWFVSSASKSSPLVFLSVSVPLTPARLL
jgi:hypothetical protein